MAKLKAPLLSLGASGAIAKAIVFFSWKGLNVAREYVVPANPNTTAQQTQRGWLKEAVDGIHTAMKAPTNGLDDADKSAFALLGSLEATPRTWFNTLTKMIIEQRLASKNWAIFTDGSVTPGVDKLTVQAFVTSSVGGDPTDGKLWYGTSKSALLSSIACTVADLAIGKEIPGLNTGTRYYVQYRPTQDPAYVGSDSGIYYGVPL